METLPRIGLAGLGVMGQNLTLNIADKGFPISVYNRTASKVDETVGRAASEGRLPIYGHRSPAEFVLSIQRPRSIIVLVKDGSPVDETIHTLSQFMEPGDAIIDAGNAWYESTERRICEADARGLLYLGMGVYGSQDAVRHGPALTPGGSFQAYQNIEDVLTRISAQAGGGPCVTYIGTGGSGNFVEMVHKCIQFISMQLLSETYGILKMYGGLSNRELAETFAEWDRGELESFLMEVAADIFKGAGEHEEVDLVGKILVKTGMAWTGYLTVDQALEFFFPFPTIAGCHHLIGHKEKTEFAVSLLDFPEIETVRNALFPRSPPDYVDKKTLVHKVRETLYAANICSYAQGMDLLGEKSEEKTWNLNLRDLAGIFKGGCITRSGILDSIKRAYERKPDLTNLITDSNLATKMNRRVGSWRSAPCSGIGDERRIPAMYASLRYFMSNQLKGFPRNLFDEDEDNALTLDYEPLVRSMLGW